MDMDGAQDFVDDKATIRLTDMTCKVEELEAENEKLIKIITLLRKNINEVGNIMLGTAQEVENMDKEK